MSEAFLNSIVTVLLGIIGVATLAVVVSSQANTTGVLSAGGGAINNLLKTAISPVTSGGGGALGNLGNIPGLSGGAGYSY